MTACEAVILSILVVEIKLRAKFKLCCKINGIVSVYRYMYNGRADAGWRGLARAGAVATWHMCVQCHGDADVCNYCNIAAVCTVFYTARPGTSRRISGHAGTVGPILRGTARATSGGVSRRQAWPQGASVEPLLCT